MLQVKASVLQAPAISYAGRKGTTGSGHVTDTLRQSGKWYIKDFAFSSPAVQNDRGWTYLNIARPKQEPSASALENFYDSMKTQLDGYGIKVPGHEWRKQNSPDLGKHQLRWDGRSIADIEAQFRTRVEELVRDFKKVRRTTELGLLFVLLPNKDTPLYAAVKSICELDVGIQTICHVCFSNTRQPFGPSINGETLGNMAMKFNLKMSTLAVNQCLTTEAMPSVLKGSGTMIMGIDVTHAGAGALLGAPSIAAVVGSTNDQYSQFPAILEQNERGPPSVHPGKSSDKGKVSYGLATEEVLKLRDMVKRSVSKWMKTHDQKLPDKLVVYRDGLSEEQLDMCRQKEIPRIRAALTDLRSKASNSKESTELIVVCTIKRHHVRFFKNDTQSQARADPMFGQVRVKKELRPMVNPLPGTLVDSGVTLDNDDDRGDFFLISHDVFGNEGTARPTHYVVLENDLSQTVKKQDIAIMVSAQPWPQSRSEKLND
jgi:eukaryotic translation initiation factor 2C